MAGIKASSDWITGYATTADQAADDLAGALETLRGTPLTSAAFGDAGKQLGTAGAYQGAADTLQQQVSRAADALHSAADNLRTIATQHTSSDAEAARVLRAVHGGGNGVART